ncbi:MAG: T9SS type A sorting domain-containing protein [bacterium]
MRGTFKVVFGLALVIMLLTATVGHVSAQTSGIAKPLVPNLSLVGEDGGYDARFYPDGRLWLPTAKGEPREFLLPVFISNNWFCYYCADNSKKRYIPNPIMSFKFSLLYDSKTLRAVGVETVPPQYLQAQGVSPEEILASKFAFDCGDEKDNYYWHYIDPVHWATTNEKDDGRRFTIVGTSGVPLPTTPDADRGEATRSILLFVRFQVIATSQPGQTEFISKKPLYIDNREIKYNDMDVTKDRPVVEFSDYDIIEAATDYPGAPTKIMTGLNNEGTTWFNTEPYKEGSIAVHFFDKLPAFDFVVNLEGQQLIQTGVGKYELVEPISIDSNCATPRYAERIVRLLNKITGTRMMYPSISSDRDWLLFKTDKTRGEDYILTYKTKSNGDIPYIDNGLLGNGRVDPIGAETIEQKPIYLSIVADWKKLSVNPPVDPTDLEKAGHYDGTITFLAPYAEVNPVQLKVKFTFIRNPFEPLLKKAQGEVGGINLTLFNSAGQTGEQVKLVFGTGRRATNGVDWLFGEDVYNSGLSTDNLDARFFPMDPQFDGTALAANGFQDIAPDRYNPRTHSRDIRQFTEDQSTYVYHVKFNSGGADKYPVILEWDLADFPDGSQLYLRDDQNGKLFPAVDMRIATQISDTRRSFTFLDSRIKDFYIEYTLPHQFTFVNEYGSAAIHQGWNMLSLPVRPLNNYYSVVYPNALNIPYHFTMNQHQQVVDGLLKPGMGYFIKYSNVVDSIFKGSLITNIEYDPNNSKSDAVRVFVTDMIDPDPDEDGSWNMVGGLSFPTSIDGIYFKTFRAGELAPDPDFTQKFGVWKYETNQGYKEVQTVDPGYAYWIKTNRNGYYNLKLVHFQGEGKASTSEPKDNAKNTASKVIVRDNAHNEGTLYLSSDNNINDKNFELPPVPPQGIFDVRFNGNKYLTNAKESEINLNGVEYPLALNINNADADYVFTDAISGKVFGSISKGFTGSVVVEKAMANVIKVAKQTTNNTESGFFAYPNPVESVSTVNFSIPSRSNVTLKLYDVTGNEVMTLANEVMESGSFTRSLDSSNLPAGSYICKLTAGASTSFIKVTIVK